MVGRYSSQPAMSWPSKRLRKSGPTSTTSPARDEWPCTAAVPAPLPLFSSPSSQPPPRSKQTQPTQLTPCPPRPLPSNLRPRSHDLVLLPRAADKLPRAAQPDHRRARADGPDRLRVDEPVLLPVLDGRHGGHGPEGEAVGDVL